MVTNLPKYISHTVLINGGSYNSFLEQLKVKYPQLFVRFTKIVGRHYYILQIEDHGIKELDKRKLYELPILALREEFSSFVFFKTIKSYNNVLSRMCDAKNNKDAPYLLLQHMLTPFEKSCLAKIHEAENVEIEEETETNDVILTCYRSKASLTSMELLENLFPLNDLKVDGVSKDFSELTKKQKWIVGIC